MGMKLRGLMLDDEGDALGDFIGDLIDSGGGVDEIAGLILGPAEDGSGPGNN